METLNVLGETITTEGYATHRLKENPWEARFVQGWDQLRKAGHTLQYMLSPTNRLSETTMTERDERVAATVIQWLGSPVGRAFLESVTGHRLPEIKSK